MPTLERAFVLDDLVGGEEAFLTSSLRAIAPIARVGDEPIGRGRPGPITQQLSTAYRTLVNHECRG
jgi:branched-subunit amino acid aminotransferase/4-amino-4-deoxychorismate lyase